MNFRSITIETFLEKDGLTHSQLWAKHEGPELTLLSTHSFKKSYITSQRIRGHLKSGRQIANFFRCFQSVVYWRPKYLAEVKVFYYLAFGFGHRSFILNKIFFSFVLKNLVLIIHFWYNLILIFTLGWLRLCTVLSNWKIHGRHKIFWLFRSKSL